MSKNTKSKPETTMRSIRFPAQDLKLIEEEAREKSLNFASYVRTLAVQGAKVDRAERTRKP